MQTPMPIEAPEEADTVYALTALGPAEVILSRSSGLFRSRDGGKSWLDAYAGLFGDVPMPTTCLAVSPGYPLDPTLIAGVPGGVVRSVDGGESWQAVLFPEPAPLVIALAFSPQYAADQTLFAASVEDGLFCSRNAGDSWDAWNFGLFDPNLFSLALSWQFGTNRCVYVGSSSGVFRSQNGGYSWQALLIPQVEEAVLSLLVCGGPGGAETLLVGCEGSGLFASSNEGVSWKRAVGLPEGKPVSQLTRGASCGEVFCLAGEQVYRSEDDGAAFQPIFPDGLLENEGTPVLCCRDGSLWLGNAAGVVRWGTAAGSSQ